MLDDTAILALTKKWEPQASRTRNDARPSPIGGACTHRRPCDRHAGGQACARYGPGCAAGKPERIHRQKLRKYRYRFGLYRHRLRRFLYPECHAHCHPGSDGQAHTGATRAAVLKGILGGINGYITKPFQIHPLVKAVKTVLGLKPDPNDKDWDLPL